MKRYTVIAVLALLLGMSSMTYAGAQLADTRHIYNESNSAYEDLREQVKASAAAGPQTPPEKPGAEAPPAETPRVDIPELGIDFGALRAVNQDAAAWLYGPGTVIDYPVMKADDYNYYLNYLPDGTRNANGSLFIDYNSAPGFTGRLTVVYGHNMKSEKMFGTLTKYKNQKYYDEHPYMYLYTEQGNYRIDLMYGCVIGAGKWREQAFMFEVNAGALLSYAAHNTTFSSGVKYDDGDRIIALSTCSYEFDDARFIVIGVIRDEY